MTTQTLEQPRLLDLKPGELVRIRSAAEIFSTLDEHGALDNLPFMPEMLRYCGQTHRVFKRADKTCDGASGLHRMENTVHLSNLRCVGSSHGGCELGCLMYWKEAWLERDDTALPGAIDSADPSPLDAEAHAFVEERLIPATRKDGTAEQADEILYRCQATEIRRAGRRLRGWDFDQYPKDVRNWGLRKVIRAIPWIIFNKFQRFSKARLPRRLQFRGGESYPFIGARPSSEAPPAPLQLQPGELVRIKTIDEIRTTLQGSPPTNRGLTFDPEMVRYCGRLARVRGRVSKLVNEHTGKMVLIKSDCIVLDGIVCTADFHRFCTRSDFPFWREAWLERIDVPTVDGQRPNP